MDFSGPKACKKTTLKKKTLAKKYVMNKKIKVDINVQIDPSSIRSLEWIL